MPLFWAFSQDSDGFLSMSHQVGEESRLTVFQHFPVHGLSKRPWNLTMFPSNQWQNMWASLEEICQTDGECLLKHRHRQSPNRKPVAWPRGSPASNKSAPMRYASFKATLRFSPSGSPHALPCLVLVSEPDALPQLCFTYFYASCCGNTEASGN